MAEHIYIENMNQRITAPSNDAAIRRLADTLNALLDRLEKEIRKQTIFISDASHEMRTPISIIKGYVNMIDRWGKNEPAILQEAIGAIQTETDRISTLIHGMLSLVRYGEDHHQMEKEWVSLNAAAAAAVKEAVFLNEGWRFKLIEHSQENVYGNGDMLVQLIRVFLDNGIKYTKEARDPLQVSVSGDENGCYLSVKDSGIGISEEDLPFIFDRFYRADKSRSKRVPGLGIGLAIADRIARAHGATIAVYSELNAGTEFIVSFPRLAAE